MKTFLLTLLLLSSCSQKPERKFKKLISQGRCEEAASKLPNFKIQKVTAKIASVPAQTVSYVLTSAAYGADLVFYVSKGIIIPLAVCAPLAVLSAQSAASSPGSFINDGAGQCVYNVAGETTKWKSSQFGDKTYENTAGFRCPNYNFTVDHILAVSECYEKNGQKEQALEQLLTLSNPKVLGGCIDDTHLAQIDSRILVLKN